MVFDGLGMVLGRRGSGTGFWMGVGSSPREILAEPPYREGLRSSGGERGGERFRNDFGPFSFKF